MCHPNWLPLGPEDSVQSKIGVETPLEGRPSSCSRLAIAESVSIPKLGAEEIPDLGQVPARMLMPLSMEPHTSLNSSTSCSFPSRVLWLDPPLG